MTIRKVRLKNCDMRALSVIFFACLASYFSGCSKPAAPAPTADEVRSTPAAATPPAATPQPNEQSVAKIDACSLLTSEEIEAVQGEPLKESKPGEKTDRGIALSDCYLTLPTFSKSVSLVLGQRGPDPAGRTVAQFWDESFISVTEHPKSGPPRKIEGLGDDAYWMGDERMGALFVLKGSRYLRISVGGPGNQDEKIERCRKLAEKALTRL